MIIWFKTVLVSFTVIKPILTMSFSSTRPFALRILKILVWYFESSSSTKASTSSSWCFLNMETQFKVYRGFEVFGSCPERERLGEDDCCREERH